MKVLIGKSITHAVHHDFDRTPHLIGGGTTRYGKTNLIKSILTSLVLTRPNHTRIHLIDLKAGVEFLRYRTLNQVQNIATSTQETYALLKNVMSQLEHQKQFFQSRHYTNITETSIPDRTYIIVDEAGDLVPESFMSKQEKQICRECQWMLAQIARIGGAFGFRLLFFSQYNTADVLPRQIKQNADAKICFKIQNKYASEVILGEGNTQAAKLPKIPGRAIYMDGIDMHTVQVPKITDKQMFNLLKKEMFEDERPPNEDIGEFIQFRDID